MQEGCSTRLFAFAWPQASMAFGTVRLGTKTIRHTQSAIAPRTACASSLASARNLALLRRYSLPNRKTLQVPPELTRLLGRGKKQLPVVSIFTYLAQSPEHEIARPFSESCTMIFVHWFGQNGYRRPGDKDIMSGTRAKVAVIVAALGMSLMASACVLLYTGPSPICVHHWQSRRRRETRATAEGAAFGAGSRRSSCCRHGNRETCLPGVIGHGNCRRRWSGWPKRSRRNRCRRPGHTRCDRGVAFGGPLRVP